MTNLWKFGVVAALVAALGALAAVGLGLPAEEAVPRAYQCEVYTEQGCGKYVAASGGEIEIQSGGELEALSGALVNLYDVDIGGDLVVTGTASWGCSDTTITGSLTVSDTITAQDGIITNTLVVTGDATFNGAVDIDGNISSGTGGISVTDTISVQYAANFDSTVTVGDDVTFANGTTLGEATDTVLDFSEFLAATEQSALVLTAQLEITPTGTYQPITSGSAISTSLITSIMSGTVNGQMLLLVNENASDAITIVDGANVHCGSDRVLGATDTLFVFWDGVDWLCFGGYSDN